MVAWRAVGDPLIGAAEGAGAAAGGTTRIAFVTGGSGTVGRALVERLAHEGTRVLALARSRAAAGGVEAAGAEPVWGDLERPEGWAAEARAADVVFHLGLPRMDPPLRAAGVRLRARRAAAQARALHETVGDRAVVMASSALAWGHRPDGPAGEDDPARPTAMSRPALAAERALAGPGLRVVRLPWVYGPSGPLSAMAAGLERGTFRIVGPGDNRWSLISADDAAAALCAAALGPPGIYAAAEAGAPTQREVVAALCARPGVRRPDHLPPGLASVIMGGPLSRALAASTWVGPGRLAALGWRPADDWRRDLLSRCRPDPAAGGR